MLIGDAKVVFRSRGEPLLSLQLGKLQMTARNGELTGRTTHRAGSVCVHQGLRDARELPV
jgi:hypothetical protein